MFSNYNATFRTEDKIKKVKSSTKKKKSKRVLFDLTSCFTCSIRVPHARPRSPGIKHSNNLTLISAQEFEPAPQHQ